MQTRETHRKRTSFPALSVMAEGEPAVWLAGGALTVCLAMIGLLLAIIFTEGLRTFWPARIVRYEMADGQAVMGEIAGSESTTDGKDPSVTARRHLLRTGNYELTNEHFQWIAESDRKDQGESYPKWAVTLERVEWGRFYGEPIEYQQVISRHVSAEERALVRLVEYLTLQQSGMTEPQQMRLAACLPQLQSHLLRRQLDASNSQWKALHAARQADEVIVAIAESGQTHRGDTLTLPDFAAVRFERRWTGNETAWQRFVDRHTTVRAARQRLLRLEKHDVGRISGQMERARLDVRRNELRSGTNAMSVATARWGIAEAESNLRRMRLDTQQQLNLPAGLVPDELLPEVVALSTAAGSKPNEEFDRQQSELTDALNQLETRQAPLPPAVQQAIQRYVQELSRTAEELESLQAEIVQLRGETTSDSLVLQTADGQSAVVRVSDIVRAYPANQLNAWQRLGTYLGRWGEFVAAEPREANSEGGVLPAIWGTVAMTLIMCVIVVPFGILAALYLREYARAGFMVSAVRIAINNLAGVPSIVFGVFGLGFFCYFIGAFVDGGPTNVGIAAFPPSTWFTYLALLLVAATVGMGILIFQVTRGRYHRGGARRWISVVNLAVWGIAAYLAIVLMLRNPHFDGLYAAQLPNPTYGKGGVLWASLTLALLTLPVVIVATEEALAAVPNSLREGSYASGASQWQTIRRIVLPHAMPGIMTGMILAMARGAGEVAPLMLVGAVKLAPELPLDGDFPFLHGDRSFMHLGFHIFDLGFQSQNSDAARPMVFTTTLLLIGIVVTLNVLAIVLRARLRKRFQGGQF